MRRHTVVIADDHPLMLNVVQDIVSSQYEVVATCSNGDELVEAANALKPDIVVSDVDMPKLDGLAAASAIHAANPSIKVILFTAHSNPVFLRQAFKANVRGYVLKNSIAAELMDAIQCVIDGNRYVSETVKHHLDSTADSNYVWHRPDLKALTVRQLQILQLIGTGEGSKQIAAQLEISVKTVDFHRAAMVSRFGLHSIAELVLLAAEQGLIHHPAHSPRHT